MSVKTQNTKTKRLPCLRCGEVFWTDRCHRICNRCAANITETFMRPVLTAEGVSAIADYPLAEELSLTDTESRAESDSKARRGRVVEEVEA